VLVCAAGMGIGLGLWSDLRGVLYGVEISCPMT